MSEQINSVAGQLVGIPVGQVYTAGKGIKIDNVNKVVSVDETVLYEASSITNNEAGQVFQLSEPITNFERVRFICENMEFAGRPLDFEGFILSSSSVFISPWINGGTPPGLNIPYVQYSINSDGNLVCDKRGLLYGSFSNPLHTNGEMRGYCLMKVIGIHRISGGNT